MIKILLIISTLLFTSCANKRGFSSKFYNDCKEYYDLQGYYHKDCPENILEYQDIKETGGKIIDAYVGKKKEEPKGNVW